MASSSHLELEPFAQQNDSESLGDIMPTYRDILQCSTLHIFSGGRCIGDIDPKGSVGGGLDPDFSPVKTRSARKLKGVTIE